jgi:hypothetical protein
MFNRKGRLMLLNSIKTQSFGQKFWLINTDVNLEIYPAKILVDSIQFGKNIIDLSIKGPVHRFLIESDLKKEVIKVSMQTQEGFFSYKIFKKESVVVLHLEKLPNPSIKINEKEFQERSEYLVTKTAVCIPEPKATLFLGSMKTQDAKVILTKKVLSTILPWFFYLFQSQEKMGMNDLSPVYQEMIKTKNGKLNFLNLLFSSFLDGFFVPTEQDLVHQGLTPLFSKNIPKDKMGILLYQLIEAMFCQYEGPLISLLPSLPKVWHQGMIHNLKCKDFILSFSWSRGRLREVEILSLKLQSLVVKFPYGIKSVRIQGENPYSLTSHQLELTLKEGELLKMDRFKE